MPPSRHRTGECPRLNGAVHQTRFVPGGREERASKAIGGGGEVVAHPLDVTFPIHTDRFQHITTRFHATGIGYAAINSFMYKDIRDPCWLNASSEDG